MVKIGKKNRVWAKSVEDFAENQHRFGDSPRNKKETLNTGWMSKTPENLRGKSRRFASLELDLRKIANVFLTDFFGSSSTFSPCRLLFSFSAFQTRPKWLVPRVIKATIQIKKYSSWLFSFFAMVTQSRNETSFWVFFEVWCGWQSACSCPP